MKVIVFLINLALGLYILFLSVPQLLYTNNNSPGDNTGSIIFNIVLIIIGVLFVCISFAFRKDKRWAIRALPALPFVIGVGLLISVYSASPSDVAWTGGIIVLFAVAALIFSAIEAAYVYWRKPTGGGVQSIPPLQ